MARSGGSFRCAALAALEALAAANEPVALLLADDTASDLLAHAHQLYPQAKRVLLVDRWYAQGWQGRRRSVSHGPRGDLTILAKLSRALARARAVPLAA